MNAFERLDADFAGTGVTTGHHPMALIRKQLPEVTLASDLPHSRNGQNVRIAGLVICRQRPGTAKGFVFVSLEDETGVSNAIIDSDNSLNNGALPSPRNRSSPSEAKSKIPAEPPWSRPAASIPCPTTSSRFRFPMIFTEFEIISLMVEPGPLNLAARPSAGNIRSGC